MVETKLILLLQKQIHFPVPEIPGDFTKSG